MNILFAVSECDPFVKSGGLADVAAALPKALNEKGLNVRVILPCYGQIPWQYREQMTYVTSTYIRLGWRNVYCGLLKLEYEGTIYYFIDNEYYFHRDGLYTSYKDVQNDEAERFAFFSRAVLEMLPYLEFLPEVIHTHDWHTAMIGYLLNDQYRHMPYYRNIRTVFTIHNIQFQGMFDYSVLGDLLHLDHWHFHSERIEHNGCVNFMKGGILSADRVTTVSPTYRDEIQSEFFGYGLDGLLRSVSYKLDGVLNGIDLSIYDPATDTRIPENYDLTTIEKKAVNKAKLQEKLGLEVRADVPIIALVSRLSMQKGIDLIRHVFHEMMHNDVQFILLGSGEKEYEHFFSHMEHWYKGKVCAYIGFNAGLAQEIYAGADLFLMPSLFEPCGLSQIISMNYGTLPIVRETGGLRDTVPPFNEYTGEGTGFTFANYNAHDMLNVINLAVNVYHSNKPAWNKLVENAMTADYSWDVSAQKYEEIYEAA